MQAILTQLIRFYLEDFLAVEKLKHKIGKAQVPKMGLDASHGAQICQARAYQSTEALKFLTAYKEDQFSIAQDTALPSRLGNALFAWPSFDRDCKAIAVNRRPPGFGYW